MPIPTHPLLMGRDAAADELLWSIWHQAAVTTARMIAPTSSEERLENLAAAGFATEHPEVNQALALWREGYHAPAATLRESEPPSLELEEARPAIYAERQALRAVTDPGDPDTQRGES